MFSWFTRKPKAPQSDDAVWMTQAARADAIVRLIRQSPNHVLLVAFFEASAARLCARLAFESIPFVEVGTGLVGWQPMTHVVLADRLAHLVGELPEALDVCVTEYHPLPYPNRALLEALETRTRARPMFHAALDEPMMLRFGGGNIVAMMERMGQSPDEPIQHAMVTKAMANAREKVGAKVNVPRAAASMEEWLERNLGRG
ncbi:MAG: hypothetical protein Q8P18_31135 [Pseudomonadota bacterium]|nr:hypothetical protein [Pseudomonadota bacterium]